MYIKWYFSYYTVSFAYITSFLILYMIFLISCSVSLRKRKYPENELINIGIQVGQNLLCWIILNIYSGVLYFEKVWRKIVGFRKQILFYENTDRCFTLFWINKCHKARMEFYAVIILLFFVSLFYKAIKI